MKSKTLFDEIDLLLTASPLYICKDDLKFDDNVIGKSSKHHTRESELIINSVEELGYDSDAFPLLVFADDSNANKYTVLGGKKRLRGARRNDSIKQLPCLVMKAKNLSQARQFADKFNSFIYNIREKLSLCALLVNYLDRIYICRPRRVDLALSPEQFELLQELSGESKKTLERALRGLRLIYKDYSLTNTESDENRIKDIFEAVLNSPRYSYFNEFFNQQLKAYTFEQVCISELAKNPSKLTENSIQSSTIQTVIGESDENAEVSDAEIRTPNYNQSNSLVIADKSLLLINFLKSSISSNDDIEDFKNAKNILKGFLTSHPTERDWIYLLARCVAEIENDSISSSVRNATSINLADNKPTTKSQPSLKTKTDLNQFVLFSGLDPENYAENHLDNEQD